MYVLTRIAPNIFILSEVEMYGIQKEKSGIWNLLLVNRKYLLTGFISNEIY